MSNSTLRVLSIGMFAVLLLLMFQLRDRDLEFVLEADFWSSMITAWRTFFETGSLTHLPVPTPHAYLDSQFIAYALASGGFHAVVWAFPSLGALFPSADSYNLAGANLVNGVAYAMAALIFFRTMIAVTGSAVLAAPLSLMFLLSPSMLAIGFVRCDYLAMLPITALFCGGLMIAQGKETRGIAIGLGLALALVATIKINGAFFALFLIIGLGARYLSRPEKPRILTGHIAVFSAYFAVATFLLMFRHWIYLNPIEIISNFWQSIELVRAWTRLPSDAPFYYYHISLLAGPTGWLFIYLYLAASALVIWQAITARTATHIYLAISFVAFSLIVIFGYKYLRGGYHLLPIFIANIGVATTVLGRSERISLRYVSAAAFVSILIVLTFHAINFTQIIQSKERLITTIDQTRRAPRQWLKENVPAQTVICVVRSSQWANPPIGDLGLKEVEGPLDFPYLDYDKMVKFGPPTLADAAKSCPIMLLNDFHQTYIGALMRKLSPAQADSWDSFYNNVRKNYKSYVFEANEAAFGVRRIEIMDLRHTSSR